MSSSDQRSKILEMSAVILSGLLIKNDPDYSDTQLAEQAYAMAAYLMDLDNYHHNKNNPEPLPQPSQGDAREGS